MLKVAGKSLRHFLRHCVEPLKPIIIIIIIIIIVIIKIIIIIII